LVLAIGVLAVASLFVLGRYSVSAKELGFTELTGHVDQTLSDVRKLFGADADLFASVSMGELKSRGGLGNFAVVGNVVNLPQSVRMTLAPITAFGVSGGGFAVALSNVGIPECVALGSGVRDITGLTINERTVPLPVVVTILTSVCGEPNNALVFESQ